MSKIFSASLVTRQIIYHTGFTSAEKQFVFNIRCEFQFCFGIEHLDIYELLSATSSDISVLCHLCLLDSEDLQVSDDTNK